MKWLFLLLVTTAAYCNTTPQGSTMTYTTLQQEQTFFIGLPLRTHNTRCATEMPAHKEKFFREDTVAKIPNKVNGDILAVYTDDENDCNGEYSWMLGCEVSSLDDVPTGLVGKVLPVTTYAVFTTKGKFPDGLIEAWQTIWKTNLSRAYTTDFELYQADFNPQTNPTVTVYIALTDEK